MFPHQGRVRQISLGMDICKERKTRQLIRKSKETTMIINANAEPLFSVWRLQSGLQTLINPPRQSPYEAGISVPILQMD